MARQHRIDEAEYLAEAQVRSRILAEIRGRVRQPQPLEDAAAGGLGRLGGAVGGQQTARVVWRLIAVVL